MAVGFLFVSDRPLTRRPESQIPSNEKKINTVTTEHLDPDIELRRIHAVRLERDPDERGRLMAAAFAENGLPVVLVLNTN
jgi:hypothetical protein